MNIFMVTVSDEKDGYVKINRNEFMEAMRVIYENGFEDGKRGVETQKPIEPSKIYFIGGGEPWRPQ